MASCESQRQSKQDAETRGRKLVVTGATLVVTGALLVVTKKLLELNLN